MCFTPGTPADRNYGAETTSNLISQINLAPAKFDSEAKFQPMYTDLAASNLSRFLNGANGNPGAQATLNAAQSTQRGADIADVNRYGLQATNAFRAANPQQTLLLDKLNKDARRTGSSPIQQELEQQALSELKMGARLDPSLQRQVAQSARAAWSDRGLAFSPGSATQEINMTGDRALQLRADRRAFAGGVNQQGMQQQQSNRGFGLQVGQMNSSNSIDPFQAILGRPAGSAALAPMSQPGNLFNPESAYGQNIYNQRYNAQANAEIEGARNEAQFYSQMMNSGTSAITSL